MLHGYVIKMHTRAVDRSVLHSLCFLCTRLVLVKLPLNLLLLLPVSKFVFVALNVFSFYQNWSKTPLLSKLKDLAGRRKLEDLTIGPVLTVSFILLLSHPI